MGSDGVRISSAEANVLNRLALAPGGCWSVGDRPLWESRHWTLHLLNILASKGMVAEVRTDHTYSITRDGLLMSSRY